MVSTETMSVSFGILRFLKGQYFHSGMHFIPQTLVTYGGLSFPLL